MQEIILVIHLILTISLVILILIQKSSGGALGMGGGQGGMMSGRSAATLLTKVTTYLAVGFFMTSIGLAVIAKQQSKNISVFDGNEQVIEKVTKQNKPVVSDKTEPVIPESE